MAEIYSQVCTIGRASNNDIFIIVEADLRFNKIEVEEGATWRLEVTLFESDSSHVAGQSYYSNFRRDDVQVIYPGFARGYVDAIKPSVFLRIEHLIEERHYDEMFESGSEECEFHLHLFKECSDDREALRINVNLG